MKRSPFLIPLSQQVQRFFMRYRTMVHPVLQQKRIGSSHLRPGRYTQNLHDLLPIEVGANFRQFFLLCQFSNAMFKIIVSMGQPVGLAPIARGDICSGQPV